MLLSACASDNSVATPPKDTTTFHEVKDGRATTLTFGDADNYNDSVAECDGSTRVITGKFASNINIQLIGKFAGCDGVASAGPQALLKFGDTEASNDVLAECDGTTRVYHHQYTSEGLIATEPNSPNCQPAPLK